MRLAPESEPVLTHFAWLLATHPAAEVRDGRRAADLAERAWRLAGDRTPRIVDVAAAARAEAGDFAGAIALLRAAAPRLPAAKQQTISRLIEQFGRREPIRAAPRYP